MSTSNPPRNYPGARPADGGNRQMILIVGEPFTGKSTAAATFPNPLFLDFDHKTPTGATLTKVYGTKFDDPQTIPFWDAEFCDKLAPRRNPNHTPNRRDALLNYFKRHVITADAAARIPYDTTLILDSVSALEEAIHRQIEQDGIPISPKTGKPDGYYLWAKKIDYLRDFFAIAQAWPGTFICIMHEQPEYDEEGKKLTTIKPLMSGSYANSLPSKFTGMFRQRIVIDNATPYFIWDVLPTAAFKSNNALNITKSPIRATHTALQEAAGLAS